MSGIEVAGLVFGVVPIVVEILKSYSTAKRRLTTFQKHAEVVCDIHLRFQVAAANFNNDCRLLLQAVVTHPGDVSEMIGDPKHRGWQEQGSDIEKRLRSLLQQDYELCQNIVTRLRDILRETQASLIKLEGGMEKAKQPQHEITRKLWHAFNTSRKENEYIRQLDSLDKWNKSLSKLRKQRCKIQKRRNVASACIIRKAVPRSYQQIRVASQQLGESLHDSWSCTNDSHSGHQAKLSLDARSGLDDVQLDIVVACQPRLGKMHQK
jgi:cysteinyl-tRNA synthetase